MSLTRRRWLHRLLALSVLVLTPTVCPPVALGSLLAVVAVEVAALVWLFWALVWLAPDGTRAHRRRAQWSLAFGTLLTGWLLLTAVLALVPAGPTIEMQRELARRTGTMSASSQDTELGWAPVAPPDVVGSRLQRVDPTKPRVLVMGDSIIYGPKLADNEVATWHAGQKLPGWQVLNAAVSGWSIEQYMLYLRRIIGTVQPKAVVIGLFLGNDLQLTGREFSPWGHSKPLWSLRDGQLQAVGQHRQCLDTLAHSVLFRPLWRDHEATGRAVSAICSGQRLGRGELEAAVSAMFRDMEQTANAAGAQVYWVLLPSLQEFDPRRDGDTRYLRHWRTFHRLLRAGGHKVWDLYPHLVARPGGVDGLYLEDNAHFTPAGHAVVGSWLGDQLQLVLPPEATVTAR